ncbi:hypothetical protein H311_02156 [Anncaliia algerae PRA109]|nr:hypothetical protein H311_02156 [Anncaliia algerae PRA109]
MIFYAVCAIGIILLLIILYLNRALPFKKVKKYLLLNIDALGNELSEKLFCEETKSLNFMLYQYLIRNDKDYLTKAVNYLRSRQYMSRYSSLTSPAVVMRALMKELIYEQLDIEYKSGFIFGSEIYEKIDTKAPFVKHYCVITKINEDRYYTDILVSSPLYDYDSTIRSGLDMHVILATKEGSFNSENINIPKKIVSLISMNRSFKYSIRFSDLNQMRVVLYNGKPYQASSMIMHDVGFFSSHFKNFGGPYLDENDLQKIKKLTFPSNFYLSVVVSKEEEEGN